MVKFSDIKCYCINLPEATKRRAAVSKEFEKVGINIEFIEAIKHIDGYVGNTLSHMKAIRKAFDEGLNYVCVFEDDVIFAEDFNDRINILPEFDLFYLGGHSWWAYSYTQTAFRNIYKCEEIGGFHAIIYSRYALQWLIDNFTDMGLSDAFMGHTATRKLNAVCKLPYPVSCCDGFSFVTKRNKGPVNVDWQYEARWNDNDIYQIEIKWNTNL